MADHEIVYTHDRDSIGSHAVCNAGPDAICHQVCAAGCDEWGDVGMTKQGWRHRHYSPIDDAEEWHGMRSVDYCNVVMFLDDAPLDEIGPRETFEVGRIAIRAVWMGEGYDWEREPATS